MNMTFKDNSNYKYFSMIPHIITEIGLRGNEIAVYVAIKRSAGESSICTKSKAKLAKQAGVCSKTIFTIIQKLCQTNKILKKPLIICTPRLTDDGDKDTNLIEVVDIWPEATDLFIKIISGEVNITPPHVNITPPHVNVTGGVRYPLPEGQVKFTHKEEPLKKNPIYKKPTTTPTPSVVEEEDVFKKIKEAELQAAKDMKVWIDKESGKTRTRKIAKGYSEDVEWGMDWRMPVTIYNTLINKYSIAYVYDQLVYMVQYQIDHDKGKSPRGVEKPTTFLRLACEQNYALSENKRKDTK